MIKKSEQKIVLNSTNKLKKIKAFEITVKEALNKLKVVCPRKSPEGVQASSGLLQGRGSGYSSPGYGISPLGGGRH